MRKIIERLVLAVGAISLAFSLLSGSPTQAAGYNPPVKGTSIMRLVSPQPSAANSVSMNSDAKGSWDQYYGSGLNAFIMYEDVKADFSLTYKYTNAAGTPLTNQTVYLIVNKKFSCSKTTFSTPLNTNYPGGNRNGDTHAIVRDWCGDQPQMGAGQTAIIATTNSAGLATFPMKNYNFSGEMFPSAINKMNLYSKGISCADDSMCMSTTIAPSLIAHPTEAQERNEDKDLLFLHFVNPKVTASVASQKVKAGTSKVISFKLTNLDKQEVAGTTVTFETFGEGNELQTWSEVSDENGIVRVTVSAPAGTVGLQVVRAYVYGAPKGTDAKIYWFK